LVRIPPAAGPQVIGEGHAWPHKHVVLQHGTLPQINTAFDGDAVADFNAFFKKGVVAEVAIDADDRAVADMGKRPAR